MNNPFMNNYDPRQFKGVETTVTNPFLYSKPQGGNYNQPLPNGGAVMTPSLNQPQQPFQPQFTPSSHTFDNIPGNNPFLNSPGMPGWVNPDQQMSSDIYGGVYGNNNNPTLQQILMGGNGMQDFSPFQMGSDIPTGNPYMGVRNSPTASRPMQYQQQQMQQPNVPMQNTNPANTAMTQNLMMEQLKRQMLMQLTSGFPMR